MRGLLLLTALALVAVARSQTITRSVGRLQEVFAWKQITFNINGNQILQDRFSDEDLGMTRDMDTNTTRKRRQADSGSVVFNDDGDDERNWNMTSQNRHKRQVYPENNDRWRPTWGNRPTSSSTTTTPNPSDEARRFFIQYNNLPMGVERVGNRLFITLPRRRYGIPSTLNYLDLTRDRNTRNPGLRPYPNLRASQSLTSVYRTRADSCNRLWMVDNGLLEIPNDPQQIRQPAVVVFDLSTDRQILRYDLKSTDIISATTPTGLSSITIDIVNGDCSNAYAYIPDLATYGLIVYSLRANDSWRLSHNYFHFNPTAGNLNIAGQRFQWSDGIFSVTLAQPRRDGCNTAYFHPMVGTQEFSVSTCVLRNRTASQDTSFWTQFSEVGDRGANSQCTMHGYHAGSQVVFFADIGRDAISCWNTGSALSPTSVEILATDAVRLSYPSDLHVTGDEVWVMANSLPTWAYGRLDTNQYNFFIYRASVQDLIAGTTCAGRSAISVGMRSGVPDEEVESSTTT